MPTFAPFKHVLELRLGRVDESASVIKLLWRCSGCRGGISRDVEALRSKVLLLEKLTILIGLCVLLLLVANIIVVKTWWFGNGHVSFSH